MAQKFANRADVKGHEGDILAFTRTYGQGHAEREFNIGHLSFRNWLRETTGDEDYGMVGLIPYPVVPSDRSHIQFVFELFVSALDTVRGQRDEMAYKLEQERRKNERITQFHQQDLAWGLVDLLRTIEGVKKT